MDPLSAVSLAGTIVQFVSFSREIVHIGNETYRSTSGSNTEVIELETTMSSLSNLHQTLRKTWDNEQGATQHSEQVNMMMRLVEQCELVYSELNAVLGRLRVKGVHRKRESVAVTLKYIWKENEIKELEKRLLRLQGQIDSHLIADVRKTQQSTTELLQQLTMSTKQLQLNRQEDLKALELSVKEAYRKLNNTRNPPLVKDEEDKSLTEKLHQWMFGVAAKNYERAADDIIFELATQIPALRHHMAERDIINTLAFDGMHNRQAEIKDAHYETFGWVFSSFPNRPSPEHFADWLKNGDHLFWISGKPGSGKSTLMKYLFHSPQTKKALQSWAGDNILISANFYFWTAGNKMQKSIRGLLQSLLCQVLRQCPKIIPKVFPKEWKMIMDAPGHRTDLFLDQQHLIEAIRTLGLESNEQELDEYDGFDREVSALIHTLSSSNTIKFCLASRPHNVFVSSFGQDPKRMLYIHEFTDWDIRQYIKSVLNENSAFRQSKSRDVSGYNKLAEYIRVEANGVFLWVYLVVVKLLDGIENADRMSDLQRKLEQLPSELKPLFAHILSSVEPDYHEQQAQMLSVACQAEAPLSLVAYSFMDEESDFALKASRKPIDDDDLERRCEYMKKRVTARCKLLLEVVETPHELPYFGVYVTFLHRTVRDYLQSAEAQELLAARLKSPFNPRLQICKSILAQMKLIPHSTRIEHTNWWSRDRESRMSLIHCIRQMNWSEAVGDQTSRPILADLEHLFTHHWAHHLLLWQGYPPQKPRFENPTLVTSSFLQISVQNHFEHHLRWRSQNSTTLPALTKNQVTSLLSFALKVNWASISKNDVPLDAETVNALLDGGANPNGEWFQTSPWRTFTLSLYEACKESTNVGDLYGIEFELQTLKILEHFIVRGADLTYVDYSEPLRGSYGRSAASGNRAAVKAGVSVDAMIRKAMSPTNADYLLRLMEQKRRERSGVLSWLGWS